MDSPDDTRPGLVVAPPPPRPTRSDEEWSTVRVDRDLRQLAWLCAAWAHRGRVLEELVGIAYGCSCHPKVMPRDELPSRLEKGPLLDALMSSRAARDRLTVVATSGGRVMSTHRVVVPEVAAPDTRGVLGGLSAKRRELLDQRIEEWRPSMLGELQKCLIDRGTIDGFHVKVFGLELGGRGWPYKNDCSPIHGALLEASRLEVQPNKVLFLVEKDFIGEDDAAVWIDPQRLDLHEWVPCWGIPSGEEHP